MKKKYRKGFSKAFRMDIQTEELSKCKECGIAFMPEGRRTVFCSHQCYAKYDVKMRPVYLAAYKERQRKK